jgi:hypothetical protein
MSNPGTPERVPPRNSGREAIGRKGYRRPELTTYGSVAHVIRGQAAMMKGDFTGGATKMCWIAEALYGVDAPRTRLVRLWLTAHHARGSRWARLAVPVYRRCGRTIARAVRSNALIRRGCLRLFDGAVRRAHREYAAYAVGLRMSIKPSA